MTIKPHFHFNYSTLRWFAIDIIPTLWAEYHSYDFLEGVAKDLTIAFGWLFWEVSVFVEWGDDSQIDELYSHESKERS